MIENVLAGVPLYNNASKVIFSDRVSLFSEEYNGVLGFGIAFSELTKDDSHVLMYGDTYGNPGEYTGDLHSQMIPKDLTPGFLTMQ